MNNSYLAAQSISSRTEEIQAIERFKEWEPLIVRQLDAIRELQKSSSWSSLKELVFDKLTESLNSQILIEAKKQNPDTGKLNRLVGELKWAERFSDLNKWENQLQVELQTIRLNLHGKTETNS